MRTKKIQREGVLEQWGHQRGTTTFFFFLVGVKKRGSGDRKDRKEA